jgi:hypothetical protein
MPKKAKFHSHDWERLMDITPICYSELDGGGQPRLGVRCRDCQGLRFIAPRGSFAYTFNTAAVLTHDEAMDRLREVAGVEKP